MAASIIPLLARMALVHVVLIWGTNNAVTTGLTPLSLHHRQIGSKLVLASRIVYAAFLWIAKFTVSEFLKRLTGQVWKRRYEVGLQFIRWFLAVTFAAVVIATLAECQPFYKYWQVTPDPGSKCRQGHAQLITMGISDVITDLLLVFFPIPIVLKSTMAAMRKLSLVLLFSFSLILVGITLYRVIGVINRHSDQQFRSLLASLEILAAAVVSNAVVLGSFIRDRGEKKKRFRFGSTSGGSSLETTNVQSRSRTLTQRHWGSDADLAEDLGMRLDPDLEGRSSSVPRPAPMALSLGSQDAAVTTQAKGHWDLPSRPSVETDETDLKTVSRQAEREFSATEIPMPTPRRMSFFDVGGLLSDESSTAPRHSSVALVSSTAIPHMAHPSNSTPGEERLASAGLIEPMQERHRGSHAFLQDVGGLVRSQSLLQPPQDQTITLESAPAIRNLTRPQPLRGDLPMLLVRGAAVSETSSPVQAERPQQDRLMP